MPKRKGRRKIKEDRKKGGKEEEGEKKTKMKFK